MVTIIEKVVASLPVSGELLFTSLWDSAYHVIYADQALANGGSVPSNVPLRACTEVKEEAQIMLPGRLIVNEWRWFEIHENSDTS